MLMISDTISVIAAIDVIFNTIIKHGLESRAEELRDNDIRLSDIAIQLSKEADMTITKSSLSSICGQSIRMLSDRLNRRMP